MKEHIVILHDLAALRPFDDFDVNAVGTLNLLEAARQRCPEAPFVHMSTNKVYGDAPNRIALRETPTRWDYADPSFANGIAEDFSIDQSMHSLFGASKVAADIMRGSVPNGAPPTVPNGAAPARSAAAAAKVHAAPAGPAIRPPGRRSRGARHAARCG